MAVNTIVSILRLEALKKVPNVSDMNPGLTDCVWSLLHTYDGTFLQHHSSVSVNKGDFT